MTKRLRPFCAGMTIALGLALASHTPLFAQESGEAEPIVVAPAEETGLDTSGLVGDSVHSNVDEAGEVAVEVAVPGTVFLPVDEEEQQELTLSLQKELNRLGCDAGPEDGDWGRRSDEAMERLRGAVPTVYGIEPSLTLLALLQEMPEGTCPLICSVREEKVDGTCKLKTCPAGQYLDSRGDCKVRVAKTPSTKKKPSSGGSSKKCVTYNGRTYCN